MKKSNKKIIIEIIILLIILLGLIGLNIYSYIKNENIKKEHANILKNIKNSYYENVVVTKDTNLYKKELPLCAQKCESKYDKIGMVSKDEVLSLEDKKIKDYKDVYFKVKDYDYYVKYEDVKPYKEEKKKDSYIYLNYGKKITTKDKYDIYDGENKIYSFDIIGTYDVIINEDNFYKIRYNDKLLSIKKEDIDKEEDIEVNDKADKISVIYYENIYNDETSKCTGDTCVKLSFFKDNINDLKNNGSVAISYDDYMLWKNKKVNLPLKSVLIIVKDKSDVVTSSTDYILNNLTDDMKFNDNNNQSSKEDEVSSRYKIISKTTKDNFKSIIEGKTVVYKTATSSVNKGQGIAVLNYHFFYDPVTEQGKCNERICEPIDKFKSHLDYLKNEGFKALSMNEFKQWMYGEIELPKKSVLITIDDGAFGTDTHLPKILNEYQMKATLFLITAWWDKSKYQSPYLEIQSHGYDLHKNGNCGSARAVCLSHDDLVSDLKKSISLVDNDLSMAYPFYKYNDNVISAVKDAGFKLAFAGGGTKAYKTSNKYAIPRYEIFNTTSLDTIKKYVN